MHFYCPDCQSYLGEPNDDKQHTCGICRRDFEEDSLLLHSKTYFLSTSIEAQLRDILENDDRLWRKISSNKQKSVLQNGSVRGEIYTGNSYRTHEIRRFLLSGDNFSLAAATDGIRPHKSSKLELWPIFCTINELDFNDKSRYVILSSLWSGFKKPNIETFWVPFLKEIENLFISGFKWTSNLGITHLSKVIFPLVIADAPARCMLSNSMQFNAFYGYCYCLNQGVSVEKGSGWVRVFPFSYPLPELRTQESTFRCAVTSTRLGKPVQGIKGASILFLIPFLNVITGLIPDIMHCVFLGVVSQFINLWLGSPGQPYYIPKSSLIDDELANLKVPNEILRDFRKMSSHLGDWKASEYRNFLLFYSPVALKKLLPPVYYKHWMLLVSAMRILLQKTVTVSQVENAQLMIYKFIALIPDLYGLEHVSYNVHILLHVVEGTKNWGAPWAYSAFLYEDAGGLIKRLFHGTNSIAKQIFRNFLCGSKLREYSRHFIPLSNESVRNFYEKLDGPLSLSTCNTNLIRISTIGSKRQMLMIAEIVVAVERKLGLLLRCHKAFFSERLAVNGRLFTTQSYSRPFKKDNSIISTNSSTNYSVNTVSVIQKILSINTKCDCLSSGDCILSNSDVNDLKIFLYCDRLPLLQFPPCYDEYSNQNLTAFLKIVDRDNTTTEVIVPSEIGHKCIIISRDDTESDICIPCNIRFEKD